VSSWSVSFLQTFSNILLLLLSLYFDEFMPSRYLLKSHWWRPLSCRANRDFGKGIGRYDFFVGWPTAPQRYCSPTGSCSTQWGSRWWLSKIIDDHVLRYASPQSSTGEF
jgi:hypothetical protein